MRRPATRDPPRRPPADALRASSPSPSPSATRWTWPLRPRAYSGRRRCPVRTAYCPCRPPGPYILRRDAELVRDDLRERRLVALTLRLDAELQDRLPGRVHAQLGRVEHLDPEDVVLAARARADDLREAREPDPEQAPLVPGAALLLAQLLAPDLPAPGVAR